MLDLSFHAALPDGAWYPESQIHPGAWLWMPKYCLFPHPDSLEHNDQLSGANWLPVGTYHRDIVAMLFSQLGQVRLLGPDDQLEQCQAWIPRVDRDQIQIPVMLAFTLTPAQAQKARVQPDGKALETSQTVPPANLGEIGLILGMQGDKTGWIRCPISKLPNESQELQQRMGAALSDLASAPHNLALLAWLKQWKEIQAMARQLAADYWRAYEESQIERPQRIDIWRFEQTAALAPLTMIQEGAHASIYHKADWKEKHMLPQGHRHEGLIVPGYLYTTGKKQENSTEYWMQHPEDTEVPVDAVLASQEVLRHLAALSDRDADIVTLAPVYALAKSLQVVALTPEQILRDLGIKPKTKDGYSAGYLQSEVQSVIDAFERAAWLQLKTQQWVAARRGLKPALITAESPFLIIREHLFQQPLDDSEHRRLIGWKFEMPWLEKFVGGTEAGKQLGRLLKKSLEYSMNQPWEKRLARYLTIHLCVAAHNGELSIPLTIRNVLERCGLMPSDRDRAHPGAYAKQFEDAMNHLKRDGILGDWMPKLDRHAPGFPTRDWLDLWLDSSFKVTQAPTALAAGYQKMIDEANEERERARAYQLAHPRPGESKKKGKRPIS